MATIIRGSGGGEGAVAKNAKTANTSASNVLSGVKFVNYDGDIAQGTIPSNTATTINLGLGGSYTIPIGYHDGTGTVTVGPNTVIEVRQYVVDENSNTPDGSPSTIISSPRTSPSITCNENDIVVACFHIKQEGITGSTEYTTISGYIDYDTDPSASATSSVYFNNTFDLYGNTDIVPESNGTASIRGGSVYFKAIQDEDHPDHWPPRAIRFRTSSTLRSTNYGHLVGTVYIIHTQ